MPRNGPIFQDHHVIEQQTFRNSQLLKVLVRANLVEKDAFENRINMPADPRLAHALGVSPHSGGPIREYQKGIGFQLEKLAQTVDGQAALENDVEAMQRIAGRVNRLRDTMTIGLVNGDLYTNAPLGMTAEDIRPRTQMFLHGIDNYGRANAHQLATLNGLSSVDRGYLSVTQSEERILTVLEFSQQSTNRLTKGGDLDLQRHQLAQAIANAHQDGRIALSEKGIQKVEATLGQAAASSLRVPRGQQGFASIGLLLGDTPTSTLVRTGGLLTTGADAILTARRSAELLEQGNATAAQSEVNHALARNVGGWAGGTSMAMALGGSGYVPAAVVVADALFLAKAFEKGADLLDNRAIYHQTASGVSWAFDGAQWYREADFERVSAGSSDPIEGRVAASYEKSQQLGAMATAKAVELALGKAPPPQDPFKIPAQASEQRGLDNQDWYLNPDTSAWERQVKTGLSGANDRASYETQTATPERAQQLNQEALDRIEGNIATGPEAIAAQYLEAYAAQRAQDYGVSVPEAVESARAKSGAVLGSDSERYLRNAVGQWASGSRMAEGNLALELELTNQMRQPSLERFQQELADIQALPAPSVEQTGKNELLHRYQSAGVDLNVNPETQQAIALAVQRTLDANGVTGQTMQQLQRNETGQYGYDSPINHYQTGPDGVAHLVAVTDVAELRRAWTEVRAQQQEDAPIPDSPELRITALSAQERDAHEQALREANREGLSIGEAQQVAAAAAQGVADQRIEEALAPEVQQQESGPVEASVPPAMAAASIPPITAPLPKEPDRAQSSEMDRHDEARRTEAERAQASREAEEADRRHAVDTADEVVRQVPQAQTNHPETAEAPPMSPAGSSAPDAMNLQPAHVEPGAAVPAAHEPQRESEAEAVTIANTHQLPPQITEPQPIADQLASDWQPANEDPHEQTQSLAEESIPPHHFTQPSTDAELEQTAQPPVYNREETYAQDALLRQAEQAEQSISSEAEREELADIPPAEPLDVARLPEQQHAAPAKLSPAHPDHPDNRLYEQIREGVAELDAQHGRTPDAMSERLTGSLLVLAKDNGLDRVDHVVLSQATADARSGQNVFVVQGEMGDPAQLRAGMSTQQAVSTPWDDSMQQFDAVAEERQARAQQQALQQQDEDQRVQHEMQLTAASMGG